MKYILIQISDLLMFLCLWRNETFLWSFSLPLLLHGKDIVLPYSLGYVFSFIQQDSSCKWEVNSSWKPTHANTHTNLWVGRNQVIVHCICNFFPFSWNFKKLKLLHCRDRVSCRVALKAIAHQCHSVSGQYAMGMRRIPFRSKKYYRGKCLLFQSVKNCFCSTSTLRITEAWNLTASRAKRYGGLPGTSVQNSHVYQEYIH